MEVNLPFGFQRPSIFLTNSFSALQNILSSILDASLGYWSLAAVYASLCITSLLVVPVVAPVLGPKKCILLGATYVKKFSSHFPAL